MRFYRSGRFWLVLWLAFFALMIAWSLLTVLFWLDSTKNLNVLSVVANLAAAAAGSQAALTMRKADPDDPT